MFCTLNGLTQEVNIFKGVITYVKVPGQDDDCAVVASTKSQIFRCDSILLSEFPSFKSASICSQDSSESGTGSAQLFFMPHNGQTNEDKEENISGAAAVSKLNIKSIQFCLVFLLPSAPVLEVAKRDGSTQAKLQQRLILIVIYKYFSNICNLIINQIKKYNHMNI